MTIKAPPQQVNIPLIHKICELYKKIYLIGNKISKRNKLGIFLRIENITIEITQLIIQAALESKADKLPLLIRARTKIELLKQLIRITSDLNIIQQNKYIDLELDLQEISKMVNGWIKYLNVAH